MIDNEQQLLQPVARAWRKLGTVFMEVMFHGQRFDMVCDRHDGALVTGHGKLQLDDKVIEQAALSQGVCDRTVCIVPIKSRSTGPWFERVKLLDSLGIGLLLVSPHGRVHESVRASNNTDPQPELLRAVLRPGQQHAAPAGSRYQMSTVESDFIDRLRRVLEIDGALPLNIVHRVADSPWSSASVCARNVLKLHKDGKIGFADVKDRNGKKLLVLNEGAYA